MEIQEPPSLVCDNSFECCSMFSMVDHSVFCRYFIKEMENDNDYDGILWGSFGDCNLFD